MKVAMRAKDKTTLSTTRMIRTSFQNAAIASKTDLASFPDEKAEAILRQMAKMRKESIASYEEVQNSDRVEAERAELAIIEQWLPTLADAEQTREWVKQVISDSGDQLHPGKLMGKLMKDHKGLVDGKIAQTLFKEELEKLQNV